MWLKYQDSEGYWQDVDCDVVAFFENVAKEAKYYKAGRPKHISQVLNKCIRAACSKTNMFGNRIDKETIKIELGNPKYHNLD